MKAAALAALLFGASGCIYETTSVVKIPALETPYPVSASRHYVDGHGDVVRDTDYDVVDHFEIEKKVDSPRLETTESTVRLEPELDDIVRRARGQAVTGLTIDAASYDPGSQYSASGWRIFGWTFVPTGLAFLGLAIGIDKAGPPNSKPGIVYGIGGGVLGFGALCFVLGAVLRTPAQWHYRVSGEVVRRRPDAVPAPPPPPAMTITEIPAPVVVPASP
jgi:hypothetical protein